METPIEIPQQYRKLFGPEFWNEGKYQRIREGLR